MLNHATQTMLGLFHTCTIPSLINENGFGYFNVALVVNLVYCVHLIWLSYRNKYNPSCWTISLQGFLKEKIYGRFPSKGFSRRIYGNESLNVKEHS